MSTIGRIAATLIVVISCSCMAAPLRKARDSLAAGNLAAAVAAAGNHHQALKEVGLAILSTGLGDEATRQAATRGFFVAGHDAKATLVILSGSDDEIVSSLAAMTLLSFGTNEEMMSLLSSRLHNIHGEVRAAAVLGLGPAGKDPNYFGAVLTDPDARVRLAALQVVTRLHDTHFAAPLLADAVRRDPDTRVRAAALHALKHVASQEVILELAREALHDRTQPVRLAAVDALSLQMTGQTQRYADAILFQIMTSSSIVEALRAATALARRGHEIAREHLKNALTYPAVSHASAAAIGARQVGATMVAPLRKALTRREPEIRMQVAASLLRLENSEPAMNELRALLRQPSWIGLQAALALCNSQHDEHKNNDELWVQEAWNRIEAALNHSDVSVRAFAVSSSATSRRGFDIARLALADENPKVRVAGATALFQLFKRND